MLANGAAERRFMVRTSQEIFLSGQHLSQAKDENVSSGKPERETGSLIIMAGSLVNGMRFCQAGKYRCLEL